MKIPSEIKLPSLNPQTKPNYFSIDLKIAVWVIGLAWMQFRFRHLNWVQNKERKITGYLNWDFFSFLLLLLGKSPLIQTCVSEIIFIEYLPYTDSFTYAILFWNLFLVKFVLCMELVYFVMIVITNSSILNSALIMKKLFYCLIISYICQFKVQYNLVGFLIL